MVNRTEITTVRWVCGVKPNERKKSEEFRELVENGQFDESRRVGRDGLNMLSEKMVVTGSNVV